MNNNSELLAQLKKASSGLQFMSESDYPFEVFLWEGQAKEPLTAAQLTKQTGQAKDTPVEVVQLDNFFHVATQEQDWHSPEETETVKRYQALVKTLKENLSDVQVYRLGGTTTIDVYIVGKTALGDLAGLTTKVVET